MATFRISEHVPDVYPRKSRDFHLFCSIFDCIFGQLKYNIDSIRDITDTAQCNERLLPLLQTKLGFFTNVKISSDDLRVILKAFPTIVRNKGSRTGIEQAIQGFLKINGLDADSEILIENKGNTLAGSYIVRIAVTDKLPDTTILTEILKYVLPAGYILNYSYKVSGENLSKLQYSDSVNIVWAHQDLSSGLRPENSRADSYSQLLGRVDTSFVVESSKDLKNYDKDIQLKDLSTATIIDLWKDTKLES